MLASARFVDKYYERGQAGLTQSSRYADNRIRAHLLLPIARALYDKHVRPMVELESQHIDTYLAHCEWLHRQEEQPPHARRRHVRYATRWPQEWCDSEVLNLLFPYELDELQPLSPAAIGLALIPEEREYWLPWNRLYMDLSLDLPESTSQDDKQQVSWYKAQLRRDIPDGKIQTSTVEPLSHVRFVKEVLDRAPPLLRGLPNRWSSPDSTDELLEALQALLNMGRTRPLAGLVNELSADEYRELVEEHSCLSQILNSEPWTATCADGRRLEEYVDFAILLRQDAGFKGLLEIVPCQRQSSASGFLTRSDSATAVSGVSIAPLAALGAVAALALVLVLLAVLFRLRVRRASTVSAALF